MAAVSNGEQPLNVLQLLWVNLIMDALAALGQSLPRLCMALVTQVLMSIVPGPGDSWKVCRSAA